MTSFCHTREQIKLVKEKLLVLRGLKYEGIKYKELPYFQGDFKKVSTARQLPLYLLSHGQASTFSYKVSENSGVGRYLTLGAWNLCRRVRKLQSRALFGAEFKHLDSDIAAKNLIHIEFWWFG
jgi:hypothetical protein